MRDPERKWRFASWGLGVQSTWMVLLSVLGKLPPIDAALVADTQWERRKTRETFRFYRDYFERNGVRVEVTTVGNIRELGAANHIHMPFFTETGAPFKRQCTAHFKIDPLRRLMRRIAGYPESKPPQPRAGAFENWIGISLDEWQRMSTSRVQYVVNRYPLVELKLSRWDCEEGYKRLGLPLPGKSACIGCPYRDASAWLDMIREDPAEFADAVAFDEENRHNPLASRGRSTADRLYVWRGCKPLKEVDFEAEAKKQRKGKQVPLFTCTGEVCYT